MPQQRPPTSGYARLSQADEEEGLSFQDDPGEEDPYQRPRTISTSAAQYAPIQPQAHRPSHMRIPSDTSSLGRRKASRGKRRIRSNSGVDIKAINARLERWADEIASKFKSSKGKKAHHEERLEIHHTVFVPPDGVRPLTAETLHSEQAEASGQRMTKAQFDETVESVRTAIELGVHPKMISQGSSGSYFARNAEGKVVGVFKPKDEEPYASRNPKWTKWIHRNLFPCCFGRACLIPNLSYVSEAAAYVLDNQLRTNLVPYTDIVHLSSRAFFYDFWQRSAFYRKRKPLPLKPGSFQVFLTGFKDANIFLRDHPWPDQLNTGFRPQDAPKKKKRPWNEECRPSGAQDSDDDDEPERARPTTRDESEERRFRWTDGLQQSFREQLEKLVILDYIMRNTDRGLDNWMVKVDWHNEEVSIVSEPPKLNGEASDHAHPVPMPLQRPGSTEPYKTPPKMTTTRESGNSDQTRKTPSMTIGAIDNSLSWPWKHPDAWRSFPFGWLFLPVSLIGRPFSQRTRDHFLPMLTSTEWWSETQLALRRVFEQDSDFTERMFARQIAVMKGQAWNVVETLKTADHGPLELTRRTRVCVWDELVDVPIAIPLRSPSAEMRLRSDRELQTTAEEEEMDISTANGLTRSAPDLIKFSSDTSPPLNPNRFDLSRNPSSSDLTRLHTSPHPPADTTSTTLASPLRSTFAARIPASSSTHARTITTTTRVSFDTHRRHASAAGLRRTHSHTGRPAGSAFLYNDDGDGDDDGDGYADAEYDDGDLGFAAAEERVRNKRKVIVERLETVKSKNPVFTCC